jgi:hypothetical protein
LNPIIIKTRQKEPGRYSSPKNKPDKAYNISKKSKKTSEYHEQNKGSAEKSQSTQATDIGQSTE